MSKEIVKVMASLVLSVTMLMSMPVISFAKGLTTDNRTEYASDVVEYLNAADFEVDITFTELPEEMICGDVLLQFDTVEEAEAYLQQLLKERNEINSIAQPTLRLSNYDYNSTSVSDGWKEGTVSWWGGGNTSLFSLTNAMIRHYYSNGNISNITVQDSYMTGIVGATWTHRRGTGTALGGTDVKISVTGTWFIGLDINGFPIGASFDETINSPTINITVY